MKLEKLIKECVESLQEEAGRDYTYIEEPKFGVTINTNDGYIDLWYDNGEVEVIVTHDYESDTNHPRYGINSTNLEKFISNALEDCVDWKEIEYEWREFYMDEFQRNGFDSEADFWRWKEGR